jgi:hypothetical protein
MPKCRDVSNIRNDQSVVSAVAFRLLCLLSNPKSPRPLRKRGRAVGTGTTPMPAVPKNGELFAKQNAQGPSPICCVPPNTPLKEIPDDQMIEYWSAFRKDKEAGVELLKLNDKAAGVADNKLLPRDNDELPTFRVKVTPPLVAGIVKFQSTIFAALKKPIVPSVVITPVIPSGLPGASLTLYVAAFVGVAPSRAITTTIGPTTDLIVKFLTQRYAARPIIMQSSE